MNRIDLHLHSSASDGSLSPKALLQKAHGEGFCAVALADHDTVQGVAEGRKQAAALEMEFLPCVELSVGRELEIHLLGYGIDENNGELRALIEEMMQDREDRVHAMADSLKKAGFPVDYDEVRRRAGGAVGRPHLAQVLIEAGAASTTSECFAKYIGMNAPFYVPRKKVSTVRGIQIVRKAGGVAVLAHPGQLRLTQQALYAQIRHMKEEGLQGLECYHNAHRAHVQDWLRETCRSLDLLVTGGSDFHGNAKPHVRIGSGLERWKDQMECLDRLKAACAQG